MKIYDIDFSPTMDCDDEHDAIIESFDWFCPLCKNENLLDGFGDSIRIVDIEAYGVGDTIVCPHCSKKMEIVETKDFRFMYKVKEINI